MLNRYGPHQSLHCNIPFSSSRRLFLLLLALTSAVSVPARAQVVIDKSQSVADPRRDAGTGACGSFINYKRQGSPPMPPRTRQEAEALLNRSAADTTAIKGRVSRLVDRVNFRNGQTGFVEGDFTGTMYPDELFPYSGSSMASPTGDDTDFAMRLRGYFNVSSELAGKTLSFGLNCDDFCSLRIGNTDIVSGIGVAREIKQVRFSDAGLYPIELIYFQTTGPAYIEWAFADTAQPECSGACKSFLDAMYGGKFGLTQTARLYSAIVGENRLCQECGAPGQDCSGGSYCGNGLCQNCDLPDHCGASCIRCPAEARICSFGKCAECTADGQCPAGRVCEMGKCSDATCCTRAADCPPSKACHRELGVCQSPGAPCTTDAMCPDGLFCDQNTKSCGLGPLFCIRDDQCGSRYCDLKKQRCGERPQDEESCGADEALPLLIGLCVDGKYLARGSANPFQHSCSGCGCRVDAQTGFRQSASRIPVLLVSLCVFVLSVRRLRRRILPSA